MKKYLSLCVGSALALGVLVPSFVHAQSIMGCSGFVQIRDIGSFLCVFANLIRLATSILGALALLVFFWGLVKYIVKADDEKAKESGKNIMIWGVIALFVMFSVFGLVRFLQGSFGISETNSGNNSAPEVPRIY